MCEKLFKNKVEKWNGYNKKKCQGRQIQGVYYIDVTGG